MPTEQQEKPIIIIHLYFSYNSWGSVETHLPCGGIWNKKSPADAKGNARQWCMFEGVVWTEFKLTDPSNNVSFTLPRERQRSWQISRRCIGWVSIVLYSLPPEGASCLTLSLSCNGRKSQIFPKSKFSPSFSTFAQGDSFRIYGKAVRMPKTRVFQTADSEDLAILACIVCD